VSDEFDSLLEDLDPLGGPISEESQAALDKAAHLSDEVLPPVTGEEPLVRFLDGFQPSDDAKPIAPLILGDELRNHPNPGYDTARFLQAQWGDEVFANSAYVSAWRAEVEHLQKKREYIANLRRPKE